MVHIIPASVDFLKFSANQTFFYTFSFLISIVSKHNTKLPSSFPSTTSYAFSFLLLYFFLCNLYCYGLFHCNDSVLGQIVCFNSHFFLLVCHCHFHFCSMDTYDHQAYDHTCHTYGTFAYIVYYRLLRPFLLFFFLLLLLFFVPVV